METIFEFYGFICKKITLRVINGSILIQIPRTPASSTEKSVLQSLGRRDAMAGNPFEALLDQVGNLLDVLTGVTGAGIAHHQFDKVHGAIARLIAF